VELRLEHESVQAEAGTQRTVRAEIEAVALDIQARLVAAAKVGAAVKAEGFLSAKTKRSKKLVLHVTNIEFVEKLTEGV
jgi:primosomal replication protein N